MSRSRRVAAIVATAALAVSALAGCSASADTADDADSGLNIWYVNPLPSYPAWGASSKQFEDNAEELGYRATAVGPSALSPTDMVSMIESAIADDADGLITCNIDPSIMSDTIQKAIDAGIAVVNIPCEDEIVAWSAGTDPKDVGTQAADLIASDSSEDAQVAIIRPSLEDAISQTQVDAFQARIDEKYPDMKIVTVDTGNTDAAQDATKIGSILAAYPEVSAIWCAEGTCPGAAASALPEAGKEPGDIYVLGLDDVDTTLAAIEAGWVQTSFNQCFFYATPLAVALIKAAVDGNPYPDKRYAIPTDPITADDLPYEGCPSSAIPEP